MFETPMTDFSDYIEKNKKKRKKTFNIKKIFIGGVFEYYRNVDASLYNLNAINTFKPENFEHNKICI